MKLTKKLLALLLASTMVLSLVACSNSTSDSSSSDDSSSSSSSDDSSSTDGADTVSGMDLGGDTMTVWFPTFSSTDLSDQEFWAEKLAVMEEELNCTIELEIVAWDNYTEKHMTGIVSDTGPDVTYMYTEMLAEYIAMDSLVTIDSYFTEEEIENYNYWENGQVNGEQYTLPIIVGNPRILFVNMDLLSEAGYDTVPETWDDLIEYSLAVNENTDAQGLSLVYGGEFGTLNNSFWPFFWSAGGEIFDNDGNLTIDSDAGYDTAEFIYSLIELGVLSDDVVGDDGDLSGEAFIDGETAMYLTGSSFASQIADVDFEWSYTAYLNAEEGTEGYTWVACDSLVLTSACEYPEAGAYIMKYMTSAEVMESFYTDLGVSYPPLTADAEYLDNPVFEDMYLESASQMIGLPAVASSTTAYATLLSNLQLMIMGEITPTEAIDDTVEYWDSLS